MNCVEWSWVLGVLAQGLAAAGTALIAKALWPARWRERKPASCALCMSVWAGVLVVAAMLIAGLIPVAAASVIPFGLRYLGGVAVCHLIIQQTVLFAPPLPPGLFLPGDGGT